MIRHRAELKVQRDIELALGAEPGLILLRNVTTTPRVVDDEGNLHRFPVGLGKGSPDLVGLLSLMALRTHDTTNHFVRLAVWFCLEVKAPGETASAEQVKVHEIWRAAGAFVRTVDSVDDARAALAEARELLS